MTTLLDVAKFGRTQDGAFGSSDAATSVRYGTVTDGGSGSVSVLLDGSTVDDDAYILDGDDVAVSTADTGDGTIEAEVETAIDTGTRVAVAQQGNTYKVISIGNLPDEINNYVWTDTDGLHITPTEGQVVSGEGNVLIDSSSIGIYLGTDRLMRASSDGIRSEVYFGASTDAQTSVTINGEFLVKAEGAPSSQAVYVAGYSYDDRLLYGTVDGQFQIVGTYTQAYGDHRIGSVYSADGTLLYTVGELTGTNLERYVYDGDGDLMEGYICIEDIYLEPLEEIVNSGAKLYVSPDVTRFVSDAAPYYLNADGTGIKLLDKYSDTEVAAITSSGFYWSNLPETYRIKLGKDESDPSWSCLAANGVLNLVTTDLRLNGEPFGSSTSTGIPYGSVDSTSTSTAYTATVSGITSLTDGTCVMLHNGVVTSAAGFTININGLGAKHAYNNMTDATAETTIFNVAYTMLFVYSTSLDSGNGGWWCYRGYDSNTNTIGYQLRTNSSTRAASDKGYRYRLWFTSADGTQWVPANTSTSTNATAVRSLNTRPIDPFGEIIYYGTNGTTNANATLGATALWQQYTLTIGYSYMQSGFALTYPGSVYLKCTPQDDGSAVMDSITQSLPGTQDGYIYIYLGCAYSATAMELVADHPVYWHDGTGIRQWTGNKKLTSAEIIAAVNLV